MLSNKVKSIGIISGNSVKIDDLTCPICCSTLMEPVLLPCRHGFCLSCFNGVVEYNPLTCPCCRKRFATWFRKAKKENTLIDQELWCFIKKNLKKKCSKKDNKEIKKDSVDPINDISSVTAPLNKTQISQPGEIRKEYEEQLEAFRKQIEIEKENELKATSKLLIDLFKKETENLRKLEVNRSKETMLVANPGHTPYSLNNKKNFTTKPTFTKTSEDAKRSTSTLVVAAAAAAATAAASSSSSSLVKNLKTISVRINRGSELIKQTVQKALLSKFPSQFASGKGVLTVPPTNTHRSPDRNPSRTDSLKLEMCHFKPIRTVPTTPNKRSSLPTLKTPKPKKLLLKDRHLSYNSSPKGRILTELLLSSRESAFCQVKPVKGSSQSSQHHIPSTCTVKRVLFRNELLSPKTTEKILRRKNPIVRLKRCHFNTKHLQATVATKKARIEIVNSKNSPIKRKRNGQIIGGNAKIVRSARQNNKQNDLITDPILKVAESSEDIATLENFIEEQKKCEEIIIQERLDFELAKKLAKTSSRKGGKKATTCKNNVEVVRELRRRTIRNTVKT